MPEAPLVFLKLGGSFVTDKKVRGSLSPERVRAAAAAVRRALASGPLSVVMGHGAGSYGHILAQEYDAVQGVHAEKGWEGLHLIRDSMLEMNRGFLELCREEGLSPVTVSPFASVLAKAGRLRSFRTESIRFLLEKGQLPLVHGDVVPDSERGFTIASTEMLLEALSEELLFDRVVMVSDTPGVLDGSGNTIPRIDSANIAALAEVLKGSASPDVTGGMRRKVEKLHALTASGRIGEARLIGGTEALQDALLGRDAGGTLIAA